MLVNFLIPTHFKKINFLICFLDSILANKSDDIELKIFLIVDNSRAIELYSQALFRHSKLLCIEYISTHDYLLDVVRSETALAHYGAGAKGGLAVFKKFVGFHFMCSANKGDFYCFDSDCYMNFFDLSIHNNVVQNASRKLFIGCDFSNRSDDTIAKILDSCRNVIGRDLIDDHISSIYNWYYDLHFYFTSDLLKFFDFIVNKFGSFGGFLSTLDWHKFEHIIFVNWLCATGCANIYSYNDMGISSLPEDLTVSERLRLSQKFNYKPSWIKAYTGLSTGYQSLPETAFYFHFDRL